MTLKTKEVKCGDRVLVVKELGFLAGYRVGEAAKKHKAGQVEFLDYIKYVLQESLNEEDFKEIENLNNEEFNRLLEAATELNNWGKKEASSQSEATSA